MLVEVCIYIKEMSWFRNTIINLYNPVSAPVAATPDGLSVRLQSVRDTASLLYNRTMHYIGEIFKKNRGKCSERRRR